jgi:hypothetical protein
VTILRLNLDRLDVQSAYARIGQYIKALTASDPAMGQELLTTLAEMHQLDADWVAEVRQAGGREDIYLNGTMIELIPLPPGADAAAIRRLLLMAKAHTPAPEEAGWRIYRHFRQVGSLAVASDKALPAELPEAPAETLRQVAAAFTAVEGTSLQGLFLVPSGLREAARGMPPEQGLTAPAMMAPLAYMQWIAVGADIAPTLRITLVAQAASAEDARAARDMIRDHVLEPLADALAITPGTADRQRLVEMLLPTVNGDRLTLRLNDQQVTALISHYVVPALQRLAAERAPATTLPTSGPGAPLDTLPPVP